MTFNFLIWKDTLIEEHIIGVPGDQFIKEYLPRPDIHEVRLAKEFIKFNERSFVRLLGDMRAYNYVVEVTPDFEENQYRVRAIDFDQQCYEGKRTMYLPQYFKNNLPIIYNFKICCSSALHSINQQGYSSAISTRRACLDQAKSINFTKNRIGHLENCMRGDQISSPEKTNQLKKELAEMHKDPRFLKCKTMGEITFLNLSLMLKID